MPNEPHASANASDETQAHANRAEVALLVQDRACRTTLSYTDAPRLVIECDLEALEAIQREA